MKLLLLLATLLLPAMTHAQQRLPSGSVLTAELVLAMVQAARAEAIKGGHAVSITVVDRSGQTLAVLRDHQAACTRCGPATNRPTPPLRKSAKRPSLPATSRTAASPKTSAASTKTG